MKALQIDRTGSLDVVGIRNVPVSPLRDNDVRIRVEAAGVNPSDVGIALGRFPQLTLPRILGRDFAGTVVEGSASLVGTNVWGTGGGELGLTRDGAHAEMLTLPSDAIAPRPSHLTAEGAAVLGTPSLTAWSALVDLAGLRAGEWAIISGAAGAVGTMALQLVRALHAHPIALVLSRDDAGLLKDYGAEAIVRSDGDDLVSVTNELTGGNGANVALNAVGAPIFGSLVDALAKGGRMVTFSAAAGKDAQLDLFKFYRKRLTLFGLDTAASVFDLERVAGVLSRINPYFESKALRPPAISERFPIDRAREAYASVQSHPGSKVVILP